MRNQVARGFTIVELIIVIVVIAILASLSYVAYTSVQNHATAAVIQSDLRSAATQLEIARVQGASSQYPLEDTILKPSSSTQFYYQSDGTVYCLTGVSAKSSSIAYHVSNTSSVAEGTCPGVDPEDPGQPVAVTRGSFVDITQSIVGTTAIRASIDSIPEGSWMIVILVNEYVSADPTPPSGWTTLANRYTTNTMQTSIFAKIKQSGDSNNQDFQTTGTASANALLIWGSGSAPVSSWTMGSFGNRNTNATSTSTLTPTITTTVANSLVLSISTERTSTNEANYTSMTGASPWIWLPQADTSEKIHTIAIGYNEQAEIGTSSAMTVVYPNIQTLNATAVQLAIPPDV